MTILTKVANWLTAFGLWTSQCLAAFRFVFSLIEGLTVFGLFAVIARAGWVLGFGDPSSAEYLQAEHLVRLVDASWKAFFMLAVLLFFRPVRTFLDEVQEAYGMRRKALQSPSPESTNPPQVPSVTVDP